MMEHSHFEFLYPWVLLTLLAIPFLGMWFLIHQRRYWQDAFSFSQVSVLKHLKHHPHSVKKQRIVPVLLLSALMVGIVGLAQPMWNTQVMTKSTYLMLVLDISISMEATDISPNRLEAAKKAAIDFTKNLPKGVKLGLVFFSGNTYLVSPPTTQHKEITGYLQSLEKEDLRPGTAIGDAMITALESLQLAVHKQPSQNTPKSLPPKTSQGSIILITDGESNLGISPMIAIEEALRKGVAVYTVGIGEKTGAYVRGDIFTYLDEGTLMTIASKTGGDYYRARRFEDFKDIYRTIGEKTLSLEEKQVSLTPWCLLLSMLLVLSAFMWGTRQRRF